MLSIPPTIFSHSQSQQIHLNYTNCHKNYLQTCPLSGVSQGHKEFSTSKRKCFRNTDEQLGYFMTVYIKIIKMLNTYFLTQMTLLKYCKNAIWRILLIKISFYCSPVGRNESHNAKGKRQRGIILQELLFHPSLAHILSEHIKKKEKAMQENTRTLSSEALCLVLPWESQIMWCL